MVNIKEEGNDVLFEVQDLPGPGVFTNQLKIPKDHIVNAYQNDFEINGWTGWNLPGLNIPFLISTGTHYLNNYKVFRNVSNPEKAIVIELRDEEYNKLVIEVEIPALALKFFSSCKRFH